MLIYNKKVQTYKLKLNNVNLMIIFYVLFLL